MDLMYEGRRADLDELKEMHLRKTGALICASLLAGALSAGCSYEEYESIRKFGKNLGLAFQIRDDILDVIGKEETLGKKVGSDASKSKSTYVSILGLEESMKLVKKLIDEAKDSLAAFGEKAEFLNKLADSLINREF
jgi:geranylgeranyl diphosphate synthase type II